MKTDEIPPITHPLGKYWIQPSPDSILVDESHALMDQATFDKLGDYSGSMPSGVYEGKMWSRLDGMYDEKFLATGGQPEWLLVWYGPSTDPDKCSINSRKILIA